MDVSRSLPRKSSISLLRMQLATPSIPCRFISFLDTADSLCFHHSFSPFKFFSDSSLVSRRLTRHQSLFWRNLFPLRPRGFYAVYSLASVFATKAKIGTRGNSTTQRAHALLFTILCFLFFEKKLRLLKKKSFLSFQSFPPRYFSYK